MKKVIFIILMIMVALVMRLKSDSPPETEKEIKAILSQVSPSIVKVVAENDRIYFATGIVVEPTYVLTTALFGQHPFSKLYVETTKKESAPAKIVGHDLALGVILLKIENKVLTPFRISNSVDLGDPIVLVGAFYNQFPSVFRGIVSFFSEDRLIVNAPVAPGAAGGAVVNSNGELVGIIRGSFSYSFYPHVTFKDYSSEIWLTDSRNEGNNLCYAVPSGQIFDVLPMLKKFGRVPRSWVGISLAENSTKVAEITEQSPAQKGGIKKGDRIVEISGKKISKAPEISRMIRLTEPGSRIQIKVDRDGKIRSFPLEVAEFQPDERNLDISKRNMPFLYPGQEEFMPPPPDNFVVNVTGTPHLGIDVYELTPELAEKYGVPEGGGLLIARVWNESPAGTAGLKAADVLVKAGERKTMRMMDLKEALESPKAKESLVLEVFRDGQLKRLTIKPGDQKDFSRGMENLRDKLDKLNDLWRMEEEKSKNNVEMNQQEEIRKLLEENKRMQAEIRAKYEEELKKLQEEINKLKKKEKE